MQKTKPRHQNLEKILSKHFLKFSLVPIFIIEIALIVLYFSINSYISSKNTELLLDEAQSYSKSILENEAKFISDKLNEISRMTILLQNEHQNLFYNPKNFGLPNGKPEFSLASNGVFYKENKIGASLYYSSKTKITEKEKNKAIFTEAMDTSLKNIVDVNPNIVASYFNTWDDMNRLYPFIDKVYEQYGPHIHMEDYNFYYLADAKHNPTRKPSWTSAYLDPAGNGWMLSCLVPIYNNNFLEGVTGLDITIDVFVKNILDRKLPYNADLFMVDKDGMIIAMPEKIENLLGLKELKEHLYTDAILKTIEKPEKFNIITNKSESAIHFKKIFENNLEQTSFKLEDTEYLALQQNVKETDWKLIILIDKKNIFSSIEELQDLSNKIGYFAIAFLLAFYVIFFYILLRRTNEFSQTITKPIYKLSNQTSKITQNNSEIAVIDTNISEIVKLSINFVQMIGELNEKTLKLYKAKEEAEQASKVKDEFLANMSHELKTPLNSINILSSVMKRNTDKNLNDKQVKNLELINKSGKDLLLLVNDVLDLSELEAGKIDINCENIDMKSFIDKIYNNFLLQTNNKNLKFTLEIDDKIDSVYSDKNRLEQIIKNILNNSLKFTNTGEIKLILKDEENNIKIIIKDEGIGISKENLINIFDRFKQADASINRKYAGTGLGLSIIKELTILLKGHISVKSILNEGTSFELVFPKDISENNNSIQIEIPKEKEIKKESILIFNNNPVLFFNIIVELRKRYELIQVSNFEEFLETNTNKKMLKAILDVTTLNDVQYNKLIESKASNFVFIGNSKVDSKLEKKCILEINKTEIKDKLHLI